MRTTLDLDIDVLDAAKSLASARGVSVGAALSELARRGVTTRLPLGVRNGFPVFQIGAGTPEFGLKEIEAASDENDLEIGRAFLRPGK